MWLPSLVRSGCGGFLCCLAELSVFLNRCRVLHLNVSLPVGHLHATHPREGAGERGREGRVPREPAPADGKNKKFRSRCRAMREGCKKMHAATAVLSRCQPSSALGGVLPAGLFPGSISLYILYSILLKHSIVKHSIVKYSIVKHSIV